MTDISHSHAQNLPVAESGFSAVLTPHRSLGPTGFVVLLGAIGVLNIGTGVAFFLLGAWPVLGFCGLDVLAIYVAFRLNYRAARLYETVELTPTELKVKRVHPSGRHESWDFNPYWVRMIVEERDDDRAELKLRSHGNELTIGAFLSEEEKREFAQALKGALLSARGAQA